MVPLITIIRAGGASDMFASVLVVCVCVFGVVVVFGMM